MIGPFKESLYERSKISGDSGLEQGVPVAGAKRLIGDPVHLVQPGPPGPGGPQRANRRHLSAGRRALARVGLGSVELRGRRLCGLPRIRPDRSDLWQGDLLRCPGRVHDQQGQVRQHQH